MQIDHILHWICTSICNVFVLRQLLLRVFVTCLVVLRTEIENWAELRLSFATSSISSSALLRDLTCVKIQNKTKSWISSFFFGKWNPDPRKEDTTVAATIKIPDGVAKWSTEHRNQRLTPWAPRNAEGGQSYDPENLISFKKCSERAQMTINGGQVRNSFFSFSVSTLKLKLALGSNKECNLRF